MAKFIKKPAVANGSAVAMALVPDTKFEKAYPALFEFLALSKWEDGTPRVTGTFLAFREEGRWKACLNDRECGRSAFTTSGTWESLMADLEDGLVNGTLEWRAKRQESYQPQRKKT